MHLTLLIDIKRSQKSLQKNKFENGLLIENIFVSCSKFVLKALTNASLVIV